MVVHKEVERLADDGKVSLQEKRHSFWTFPYVCPEPVLVK
jgi:hypothetical protein